MGINSATMDEVSNAIANIEAWDELFERAKEIGTKAISGQLKATCTGLETVFTQKKVDPLPDDLAQWPESRPVSVAVSVPFVALGKKFKFTATLDGVISRKDVVVYWGVNGVEQLIYLVKDGVKDVAGANEMARVLDEMLATQMKTMSQALC